MKTKLLMMAGMMAAMMVGSAAHATTITFDDIQDNGLGMVISNGYQGLDWNNFYVVNSAESGYPGYPAGTVSSPNVALNGFGYDASFSSTTPFSLDSAYFTAVFDDGMTVTLTGYNGVNAVDTSSFTVSSAGPTLETFNWSGLTEVNVSTDGTQVAIDNLTINGTVSAAPEPAVWALMLGGIGMIGGMLRIANARRRENEVAGIATA